MNSTMPMAALLAGLLVPAAALAQNAPNSEPTPTVEPSSVNPSGARLICKYYYYNGRMLPRRECRTAREWENYRYATQQNIREFQLRALGQH